MKTTMGDSATAGTDATTRRARPRPTRRGASPVTVTVEAWRCGETTPGPVEVVAVRCELARCATRIITQLVL